MKLLYNKIDNALRCYTKFQHSNFSILDLKQV